MQFTFAGRVFPVVIVSNLIRNGALREGWFDESAGQILISDTVAREKRRAVLFHELRHAWTSLHGRHAHGSEEDATDVGTFTDFVMESFAEQGGDAALAALNPAVSAAIERVAKVTLRDRVECECGVATMAGSVHLSEPEYLPLTGLHYVRRWFECEICGRVTIWREQCSADGLPIGGMLPKVEVLTGLAAATWLREYANIVAH